MQGNRKNFGKRKAETIRKSEYCRRMDQGRSVKEKMDDTAGNKESCRKERKRKYL